MNLVFMNETNSKQQSLMIYQLGQLFLRLYLLVFPNPNYFCQAFYIICVNDRRQNI